MLSVVLVTGASGYLGAIVVEKLVKAGWRVRAGVQYPNDEKITEPLTRFHETDEVFRLEIVRFELLIPSTIFEAVKNVSYVIHTACPFPETPPKEMDDIMIPGLDGTDWLLKACSRTTSVKRLVLTSCIGAICGETKAWKKVHHTWSSSDWTPRHLERTKPYFYLKTCQERLAWDFMSNLNDKSFDLVVINPSLMLGPMSHYYHSPSITLPKRLMTGKGTNGAVPPLCFPFVDVRDVADVHINVLTNPKAAGQRILCFTENFWAQQIADILKPRYLRLGFADIPRKSMSYAALKLYSLWDPALDLVIDTFVAEMKFNNSKFLKFLGKEPIRFKDSMEAMAKMMIARGIVERRWKFL